MYLEWIYIIHSISLIIFNYTFFITINQCINGQYTIFRYLGDFLSTFKNNLVRYANKTKLFDIYGNLRRKISKSQNFILMYHRVGPMNDKWKFDPFPIHQDLFEQHIQYLIKNFEIISLNNLTKMIAEGNNPEGAVAITFDDGYKDNYEFAYPILKKYRVPATIFPAINYIESNKLFWWDELNYVLYHTDLNYIDLEDIGIYQLDSNENKIKAALSIANELKQLHYNKIEPILENLTNLADVNIPDKLCKQNTLSWNEIKKMNKNGIDFGAHTLNHPSLTNITLDEAKWEILESKNCIEEVLDNEVKSFAFPYGAFNEKTVSLVKNLGFNSSVTVIPGFVNNSVNELYQLNRMNGAFKDFHVLKLYLCGLGEDLKLDYFLKRMNLI